MERQTARLLLRDFSLSDLSDLQEILGDPQTMEYAEPPYSPEKTAQFLKTFCIEKRGGVAAVHKRSGKLIGYLLFCPTQLRVYELGWFFNRAHWGQGYAFEACAALVEYAFQVLHAHKLFAETIDPDRSLHLMEKLGMHIEGVQRQQVRNCRGQWADLYLCGLLEEDYPAARSQTSQKGELLL